MNDTPAPESDETSDLDALEGSPDHCVRFLQALITHVRKCQREGFALDGIVVSMTGIDKTRTRLVSAAATDMPVTAALDLMAEGEQFWLDQLDEYMTEAATPAVDGSQAFH